MLQVFHVAKKLINLLIENFSRTMSSPLSFFKCFWMEHKGRQTMYLINYLWKCKEGNIYGIAGISNTSVTVRYEEWLNIVWQRGMIVEDVSVIQASINLASFRGFDTSQCNEFMNINENGLRWGECLVFI